MKVKNRKNKFSGVRTMTESKMSSKTIVYIRHLLAISDPPPLVTKMKLTCFVAGVSDIPDIRSVTASDGPNRSTCGYCTPIVCCRYCTMFPPILDIVLLLCILWILYNVSSYLGYCIPIVYCGFCTIFPPIEDIVLLLCIL